jgi:ferredoxin
MPYVINSECVLCSACVSGCEVGAITEGETQCHIDPDVCIECGTCEANCPSQAIGFVEETLTAARTPA